ncbi:MAG TPA: DUF5615 family PIN-like protein, partial [Phycisphaerae bacterium]
YADENFPFDVVQELRSIGHDVVTTLDAHRAGQRIPDADQLSFAHADARAITTLNHRGFVRLHMERPSHSGVITCTADADSAALARRIDSAIRASKSLQGKLIRVIRPNPPRQPAT